jgi:hypothetical protein
MTVYNEELISGLDDLLYDVTLGDPVTDVPISLGTVTVSLCQLGTTIPLGPNSTVTLTHQIGGRWTGTHAAALFVLDLPAVGALFDKVLFVSGARADLLARCRRVSLLNGRLLRDAKRYLRLQTDEENVLLQSLINSSIAAVEAWIGRPVEARSMTFVDSGMDLFDRPVAKLRVPVTPIAALTSVVDDDGTALDLTRLRTDVTTGLVSYKDKSMFMNGPYTITATVGLSASPQYQFGASAAIQQAVVDVVADLYQRRNPAASREAEGGGIAVDYNPVQRGVGADNAREDLLPERTAAILAPFRIMGV